MSSHVRYATRTLWGPWLAIPAIGIEITMFLQRGMPWRGESLWTVDWFGISLFILGPLAAGVAAIDAAKLSRPGNIHLVVSVLRRGRAYAWAAAWCALPLAAVHLIVIFTALMVGQAWHPSVSWLSLVAGAMVQALAIGGYTAIGSALGRFATPTVAGLIGAAGVFVLNYVIAGAFATKENFQLLKLGGATVTMIGKSFNTAYLGWQAFIFAVIMVVFVGLRVRPVSSVLLPTVPAIIAVVCVIVGVAVSPATLPAKRYDSVARPPTLCTQTTPEICMYNEHRRYVALVTQPINTLIDAARAKGYNALIPQRVVEASQGYTPAGDGVAALWLGTDVYERGQFTLQDAAGTLLTPLHCPQLHEPNPDGAVLEQYTQNYFALMSTWLKLAGVRDIPVPDSGAILTPQQVYTLMTAFDDCRLDVRL